MMSAKRIKKPLAALLLLACLLLTGCQESISSLVGKPLSEVSAMFDQDAKEDRGGLQIYRSDSVQLVFSSEDTVTGYAYYNTEGEFIRSAGVIPVDRETLLGFDSMSELEEALCPPNAPWGRRRCRLCDVGRPAGGHKNRGRPDHRSHPMAPFRRSGSYGGGIG